MTVEMKRIQALVLRAKGLEGTIEALEQELKERKQELRRVLDEALPELMNELGLASVTTEDGLEVAVRPYVDVTIPATNREQALAWLREHGFGDLIKHQVIANFGRGDDELARAVEQYLEELHAPVQVKEAVHPQTLKAWAREQLEAGQYIPEDVFRVHTGLTTKIKEAK